MEGKVKIIYLASSKAQLRKRLMALTMARPATLNLFTFATPLFHTVGNQSPAAKTLQEI